MSALNSADGAFVDGLAAKLQPGILRPADPRFLEEPRGRWLGQAGFVALPRQTDEVATIVAACNAARVGIVPYGGGTGLVGGQLMPQGPVPLILSLERMRAVRAIFPQENALIVEAGVILADVQAAAARVDRLFPLSLAAEGSARIGGCLSTNAGGVNVLRYGNARALCLGLEAVLPDGGVWHGLKRLHKDNTGYDLKHLLMGAEGTLGVITAASLKLAPIPESRGTAVIAVNSPAAALSLLDLTRDKVGERISAFELMGRAGFEFMAEKLPEVRQPFCAHPEWSVLIEIGLTRQENPEEVVEAIFAEAYARGWVSDGVIARSEGQRSEFWAMREHMPLANRAIGAISSHDIALPLGMVPAFIDQAPAALAEFGALRINCFGHLGDGNLHYNVFPAKGRDKSEYLDHREDIQRAIHDLCTDMGGSFSAEHGVGRLKVGDLERYGDRVGLATMRAIKRALDPQGIMNPGALLR